MKLYLTPAQAPELAGLTRRRRKAVLRCALQAFLSEDPSHVWSGARWLFGGLLGGALAGWGVVAATGACVHWLLVAAIGAIAGAVFGNFIATHLLTEQLRPYLQRVLEERKDEIAGIQ